MITIGFFASAEMGAAASAFGVSPNPARMSTLSRVTSSCASRLAMSGAAPVVSHQIGHQAVEDVGVERNRLQRPSDYGSCCHSNEVPPCAGVHLFPI
jgi:hypothetical protein